MKIFIFLSIKRNLKGIYVTNSRCVVFTNSEKLQSRSKAAAEKLNPFGSASAF
jgi:hypothetical protein